MCQCSFYTQVLGMEKLPRPPFPFDGAWLQAGGLTLHLIADDPTIPRKEERKHWKVPFLLAAPYVIPPYQSHGYVEKPWMIAAGNVHGWTLSTVHGVQASTFH